MPNQQHYSDVKSLMGSPSYHAESKSDKRQSASYKKSGHDSCGKNPDQQQSAARTSRGPAQSLMSIDFSSMRTKGSVKSRSGEQRYRNRSSDEDSNSDRRSDWKSDRRPRNQKELMASDRGAIWSSRQHSVRAPLIVDMGHHKSNSGFHSKEQPKSLLGEYWTSVASRPARLMDLNAKKRTGPIIAPPEAFSRPDGFPSNLSFSGNRRRDEQASRKRLHGSDSSNKMSGNEASDTKKFKSEQSFRPLSEPDSRLQVIKSKHHTFVLIPSACSVPYLHGRAEVTVVKGNVSVMSFPLQCSVKYDVYSPSSGSLLALNCVGKTTLKVDEVKAELKKFGVPENDKDLESIGNNTVAIIKVNQLKSSVCDYITSFIPYTQLFTAPQAREKDMYSLKGTALPNVGLKLAPHKEMGPMCLNMSQDYEDVLDRFTTQINKSKNTPPIWLCCGAKNAGKSTFCRMLINTALKSVKGVGYLECDVGQTEFSPPATLSYHVITKPILGQPFCHQRQAERLVFFGEVAAGHNPSVYVKCLKHVLEAYKDMADKPPLVVNTMGFPEGIGLMLLIDTVQLIQPDIVVQIESHNQALNLPAITHELVALEEGWTCNKDPVTNPRLKMEATHPHELILLPTLLNQRRDFILKLKPVDLRNLSLLSSLSLGLEVGFTLTSLPPYAVPFRQLAMHVCHHRGLSGTDILAAMDATVVALCTADISQARRVDADMPLEFDEMPICDCLGLAIVRAIDIPRGLLYIVTSLPRVNLENVNTLLKGSIALPDQLILKQKSSASSPLPYVDALAQSMGVNAVRPRARMPRLTLGGNKT